MERIILHIDVNNAFLSWTAIDLLRKGYPYDIRKTYAAIAGDVKLRKGIIYAKSTPAKKKGVKTAEPIYMALKKCPKLKLFPVNYDWYRYMSRKMFSLIEKYTPDFEVYSIDECFIDYTKVKTLYGDEYLFAKKIQKEIQETLKFTVNIGIANNKLCAKMASDFSKPNQIHTLYQGKNEKKMYPLPIEDLFGIGKKTSQKLRNLKIETIKDLACASSSFLFKYFKNQADWMIASAKGIDDSEVIICPPERKGMSTTRTLPYNLKRKEEIYVHLLPLVEELTVELRRKKKYTKVIAVILKDKYFKNFTHQRKLLNATNQTKEILQVVRSLLQEIEDFEPIRLVGVRFDQLSDSVVKQISIFDDLEEEKKEDILSKTIDELKGKYGIGIIQKLSKEE